MLPREQVITDADIIETHRRDRAEWAPAGAPSVVVRARSTADVVAVMTVASRLRVPVVPRGAGSGLSGGANAIDGCIMLSVEPMDRVLDVDVRDRLAVVQPGVLNGDLGTELATVGMWYPPDPASQAFCSIGGNVNTNAGGLCCVKYGVTRDWVAALEVVLADGRVIRTGRRTRKDVAGYDLTQLLIGSEGTLGVVTEVTVRVRPLPPQASTLVAFFPTLETAGVAVDALSRAGAPSLLEIMDATTVAAVDDATGMGLERDAAALVLAQSDAGAERTEEIARFEKACNDAGAGYTAVTDDPLEGDALLTARRMAIPALEMRGATLLDDVGVPLSRIASYLAAIPRVAERTGLTIASFGHAGDGNLHPTIVFDPGEPDEVAAAQEAFGALIDLALAHGGTITGEHGVGVLKQRWLEQQIGADVLDVSHAIKHALDPLNILNPGKALGATVPLRGGP